MNKDKQMLFYDAVYGHITVSDLALQIIDTKEFQRLRRIKQLSMGSLVFPCAEHTRFSHSLGTYHVMRKIIVRLQECGFSDFSEDEITDDDYEALSIAALLHDIGHGPFSHMFEDVIIDNRMASQSNVKGHEQWTVEIISDHSTDVYQCLSKYGMTKGHGPDYFPERVISFLNTHTDNTTAPKIDEWNLQKAFSSLISSNLDADRLDYLQRDKLFCGAIYGGFDMDTIINGLQIAQDKDGQHCIAVQEEKTSDLEGYLFLRAQMYKNVYWNKQKVFAEQLVICIFRYARELFFAEILEKEKIPSSICRIFDSIKLNVEEYCKLDDYVIFAAIREWSTLKEEPNLEALAEMCSLLLARSGYISVTAEDGKYIEEQIKNEIKEALEEKTIHDCPIDHCTLPFLIHKSIDQRLYGDSNISLVSRNGTLSKLSDNSFFIQASSMQRFEKDYIYWSKDVCRKYLNTILEGTKKEIERERLLKKIELLLNGNAKSNGIDSERKYIFHSKEDLDQYVQILVNCLKDHGYCEISSTKREYCDQYFDTMKKELMSRRNQVRIRYENGTYSLTIKKPIGESLPGDSATLVERSHICEIIQSPNDKDLFDNVKKKLERSYIKTNNPLQPEPIADFKTIRTQTVFTGIDEKSSGSFELHQDQITIKDIPILYWLEINYTATKYVREIFYQMLDDFEKAKDSIVQCRTEKTKLQAVLSAIEENINSAI